MNVGVVLVQGQCATIGGDGEFVLSGLREHVPQRGAGFDEVRIQFDGDAVPFTRRRRVAGTIKQFAELKVDIGPSAVAAEDRPAKLDRGVDVAFILCIESRLQQFVRRLGIGRSAGQHGIFPDADDGSRSFG